MAKQKPLVVVNGQIQRLQPGDQIDLSNSVAKNNDTGNTIPIGTPLLVSSGNAILAQADAQGTVRVAGLAAETANDSSPVEILADGILPATTGEWDTITGETGGLSEGLDYFLSATTKGRLTVNAPDAQGEFVVRIGYALSSTEMEIEIGQPIKL
jgi:hypothetical protein